VENPLVAGGGSCAERHGKLLLPAYVGKKSMEFGEGEVRTGRDVTVHCPMREQT